MADAAGVPSDPGTLQPPVVDTIVARATGPGRSAIAVVRLSGSRSLEIGQALLGDAGLPSTRQVALRWLRSAEDSSPIDQALVTVFRAPQSYTGEDAVEFSCHGGPLPSARLVAECERLGARIAEPGEFTRRAYLNGQLDLVQAEAVGDLVDGDSEALQRAALQQLDKGLSSRLADLRQAVVGLEALLVHHIDFPDEDEPPVPIERIVAEAGSVADRLAALAATAPEGELLRNGVTTVLAGPPNSGKSSLFNALVGHERAIVTEVAGTTRDAIEARVSIRGFPFMLVDTAGLRESEDQVERIGIEVAERYLAEAQLVVLCREVGDPDSSVPAVLEGTAAHVIRVATKADIADRLSLDPTGEALAVSALSGEGLDELRERLLKCAFAGLSEGGSEVPVLTRARQRRGVEEALAEVRAFAAALESGVPAEVASTHLRPAATALEELLGIIPNDEVLDRVFRDFCIGK